MLSVGTVSDEEALMPPHPRQRMISLDTLGRLRDHGYGMFGTCLDCSALYRMDAPAAECIGGSFDIDLGALIAERGADAPVIRMEPVPCPRCGSRWTECRITTPRRR
jgi:hypothetical protein